METVLQSASKEVLIAEGRATVLIGERINPTGKKRLAEALKLGDLDVVREEALSQVEAGADVLDVNVGAAGVDEIEMLPRALRVVMDCVPTPVSLDSANPAALEAALKIHTELAPGGKPLINSVTGEGAKLDSILPLAAEYRAAVIGLAMDERGIPKTPRERLEIAARIIDRAAAEGIPRQDVIIDCLAMTVGADSQAGWVTLEAIRLVRDELDANMTLGVSNISHGLPERDLVNQTFLVQAILQGVNCPIVDAAKVRFAVLAADLLLGKDEYAMRYIREYKRRMKK